MLSEEQVEVIKLYNLAFSSNYIQDVDRRWNEVCAKLKGSGKDLSQIPIVCAETPYTKYMGGKAE